MIKEEPSINITITAGTVIKIMVTIAFGFILYLLLDMVLILLTSVVIASAIEPATRWFAQYRIPRIPAVLIVYIVSFLFITSFLYIFIPPLLIDISKLSNDIPNQIEALDFWGSTTLGPLTSLGGFQPELTLKSMLVEVRVALTNFSGGAFSTATTVFGGAFSFILILVISFYLSVQEKGIDNFLKLITPIRYEDYVISLWRRSQIKIGQWMKGQLLLGLLVGVMVFLLLTILGIKYAFVLAVLAAMLELIPIFGPIISAVPAILIALTDSTTAAVLVIAVYVLIQQFENHLLYPLVVKKIVGLSPIVVIISLIVGGQLFGFLGIILAIPMATVLMELADDFGRKKAAQMKQNNLKS